MLWTHQQEAHVCAQHDWNSTNEHAQHIQIYMSLFPPILMSTIFWLKRLTQKILTIRIRIRNLYCTNNTNMCRDTCVQTIKIKKNPQKYWHLSIRLDTHSQFMMTSSNGNIFRVTGPLCGEFTGHRWIHLTKASDAELRCYLWSAAEQTVE